jgi:hypothetical protein
MSRGTNPTDHGLAAPLLGLSPDPIRIGVPIRKTIGPWSHMSGIFEPMHRRRHGLTSIELVPHYWPSPAGGMMPVPLTLRSSVERLRAIARPSAPLG